MDIQPPAERFHFLVQSLLRDAAEIHEDRGREHGEIFAAPLRTRFGSGDRLRTLAELQAVKDARRQTTRDRDMRRESTIDLICYLALEEGVRELAEELATVGNVGREIAAEAAEATRRELQEDHEEINLHGAELERVDAALRRRFREAEEALAAERKARQGG